MTSLTDRAKKIKCIVTDVDGTLTDGAFTLNDKKIHSRTYNIKDILGVRYWKKFGFEFGIITGDNSKASEHQIKMIGADYYFMNCSDKKDAIMRISEKSGYLPSEIAYIGDDLIDISALKAVGLSAVVADGAEELTEFTHFRTHKKGGAGAVREFIEVILKEKKLWDEVIMKFSHSE